MERDYVGRPGDLRCRIEYFQMLIGLNSLQRPTSVPFTSSGVGENLRPEVVELRRYVHHLEAERDEERKKRLFNPKKTQLLSFNLKKNH